MKQSSPPPPPAPPPKTPLIDEKLPIPFYDSWMEHPHMRTWVREGAMAAPPPLLNSPARWGLKQDIVDQEELIKKYKDQIQILHSRIREAEKSIAQKKALLCPIRVLPPELFRRILAFLPRSKYPEDTGGMKNLIFVSLSWYHTAMMTPELWSSITLHRSSLPMKSLKAWISHAKRYPLEVDLEVGRTAKSVFQKLMERPEQWRTLHLTFGRNITEITRVFEALRKATRLTELSFKLSYEMSRGETGWLDLPNPVRFAVLHELHVERWEVPFDKFEMPVLRRMTISDSKFGVGRISEIAQMAPLLRFIEWSPINGYSDATSNAMLPRPACLPNIEVVLFKDSSWRNPTSTHPLPRSFLSPFIRDLSIEDDLLPTLPWPPLKALETFHIEAGNMAAGTFSTLDGSGAVSLKEWLVSCGKLHSFSLTSNRYSSHDHIRRSELSTTLARLVRSMIKGSLDSAPCPRLSKLRIEILGLPVLYDLKHALRSFLRERGSLVEGASGLNVPSATPGVVACHLHFRSNLSGRRHGTQQLLESSYLPDLEKWLDQINDDRDD